MTAPYRPLPMTRGKPIVIGVLAIIAFGCVMGFVVAWKLKHIIRQLPPPLASPDGAFIASLTVNEAQDPATYMRLAVDIRDARTSTVIYHRQSTASALRFYDLKWDGDNALVLVSSELDHELRWTRAGETFADVPDNGAFVVPSVATTQPSAALLQRSGSTSPPLPR